jgi:hypothetical protein
VALRITLRAVRCLAARCQITCPPVPGTVSYRAARCWTRRFAPALSCECATNLLWGRGQSSHSCAQLDVDSEVLVLSHSLFAHGTRPPVTLLALAKPLLEAVHAEGVPADEGHGIVEGAIAHSALKQIVWRCLLVRRFVWRCLLVRRFVWRCLFV